MSRSLRRRREVEEASAAASPGQQEVGLVGGVGVPRLPQELLDVGGAAEQPGMRLSMPTIHLLL